MVTIQSLREGASERLTVVAMFRGPLDRIHAGPFRNLLEELLAQQPASFILNLSEVTFLDLVVAQQIASCGERGDAWGCRIRVVVGNNRHVQRLLALGGCPSSLIRYPDSVEAMTPLPVAQETAAA